MDRMLRTVAPNANFRYNGDAVPSEAQPMMMPLMPGMHHGSNNERMVGSYTGNLAINMSGLTGPMKMTPMVSHGCKDILERLMSHPLGGVFNRLKGMVNSREVELMDFNSLMSNLEEGKYEMANDFAKDVELMLEGAIWHGAGLVGRHVHGIARDVRDMFRAEWYKLCKEVEANIGHYYISNPSGKETVGAASGFAINQGTTSPNIANAMSLVRKKQAERERKAARNNIESLKNTSGLAENLEATFDFWKLVMAETE